MPKENRNIAKYLDCSTSHVTIEDAEMLNHPSSRLNATGTEYGWFVWVPPADMLADYIAQIHEEGLSDAFCGVLRYARRHGCDRVLFDRDASDVDELPTFDW
jgi:hypothetical protein